MESSYNYAQSNMQDALLLRKSERLDKKEHMNMFMLSHAVDRIAIKDGCALEFGVYEGATLRHIAKIIKQNVHGFDSFVGLPESGGGTYWGKGMFDLQGRMPEVPSHVKLHKGWFEDTIPVFLNEHKEDIALLHLDPDLYSSHKTVFRLCAKRIKPGTVIVFDDFFDFPGWENQGAKAFHEFVAEYKVEYKFLAYYGARSMGTENGGASVMILKICG